MHFLDAKKATGEKYRRQLHKNAASNIEQVLEATPHKAPTIRPPKTIQVRPTRHAGYCWRSRDELHKWCTPMDPHIWPSKSRTTSSNIHTAAARGYGCSLENLPEGMNDREKWRESGRDICAGSTTWWWWYIYIYIVNSQSYTLKYTHPYCYI